MTTLQLIGGLTMLVILALFIICLWKFLTSEDWIECPDCKTRNPIEYYYSSSCKGTCSKCGKTLRASTW